MVDNALLALRARVVFWGLTRQKLVSTKRYILRVYKGGQPSNPILIFHGPSNVLSLDFEKGDYMARIDGQHLPKLAGAHFFELLIQDKGILHVIDSGRLHTETLSGNLSEGLTSIELPPQLLPEPPSPPNPTDPVAPPPPPQLVCCEPDGDPQIFVRLFNRELELFPQAQGNTPTL